MDAAAALCSRADHLRSERANFDAHWQEVADYIIPSREFTRSTSPGTKRMARIFNTLPILACEQLAGGLHGMLTSPQLRWFAMRVTQPELRGSEPARKWFEAATDRMYDVLTSPNAGFATAAHEFYLDIAAFGTAVQYVQDGGKDGPIYRSVPLAECYLSEGANGRIDTLFRRYKLTARLILEKWPDTTPRGIREAAEKTPDAQHEILHAVTPRAKGSGWDSAYISMTDKAELERGRYTDFPFVVARWSKRSGEVYGTGAGMNALPDVKLLNKAEEVNLRAAQKAIDPTIFVPDDGFLSPLTMRPGGVVTFRAGMLGENDRPFTLGDRPRPELGAEIVRVMQDRVEGIFYTRWMNLPSQPNMTATEVLQRRDEMLRLLGPMVARLEAEMLGPVIERTFRLMWENQMFPPTPPELSGAEWRVEYLGPLSISQRAADAEAIIRWFQVASQMAAVDPEVLDAMDFGEASRYLADRYNAPPSVMRSREDAQARAADRAQAAQAQMEMAATDTIARTVKQGAGAAKDLASAGMAQS